MLVFKASPETALKGTIMRSGITAIICILGISWLGSSFFEGNRHFIVGGISSLLQAYPWTFAIGMFVLSTMLFSQAATVAALYPAANGIFFLPTYGTLLAAVSFDQTGTTKIGKYLLNHSFMLPGLVTITSTIIIALLLSNFVI